MTMNNLPDGVTQADIDRHLQEIDSDRSLTDKYSYLSEMIEDLRAEYSDDEDALNWAITIIGELEQSLNNAIYLLLTKGYILNELALQRIISAKAIMKSYDYYLMDDLLGEEEEE